MLAHTQQFEYNMNASYITDPIHRDIYQQNRRRQYRLFYELFEFMDILRNASR
jgi:hypothetical protein